MYGSRKKSKVIKKPVNFDQFSQLREMLMQINNDYKLNLNSVLVSYFHNGMCNIRLHDDNEDSMNPESPIAVVSIGDSRGVDFYRQYQSSSEKPIKTLVPASGSLYKMLPGCQEFF